MKDIARLIRLQNLLMTIFIIFLMEKMVATPILDKALYGEQLPAWLLFLLVLAIVFIQAGGYVINDYFDVKIDNINRPDKLIVTRSVSKPTAMLLHQVLTALGVVSGLIVALVLRSWSLAIIYIFVPGLMWFYSSSYKRQFITGNLIVSVCAALVPLTVAIANVAQLRLNFAQILPYTNLTHDMYAWIGGFSIFAFLTTWIREVEKDLQDQTGDREMECHTMPIKIGDTWTKVFVTLLILTTCGIALLLDLRVLPFGHGWSSISSRYILFAVIIPFACDIWLLWRSRITSDYRHAQLLTKFIMLTGVCYAFVIAYLM